MVIYPQLARSMSTLFKERTTPDKWQPLPNQPVLTVMQPQHLYIARPTSNFFPERSTPDKWQPAPQIPTYPPKQPQHLYRAGPTSNFFPERSTPDKWYRIPETPVAPPKQPQHLYRAGPTSNFFPERTTPDKWYKIPEQPRLEVKIPQYLNYAAPLVAPGLFTDKSPWLTKEPTITYREYRQYPNPQVPLLPLNLFPVPWISGNLPTIYQTVQPQHLNFSEPLRIIVPSSPLIVTSQVRIDPVIQPQYLNFVGPPKITVSSVPWLSVSFPIVPVIIQSQPSSYFAPALVLAKESITVDKWYSLPQLPIRGTSFRNYLTTSTPIVQTITPAGGTLTLLLLGVGR